MMVRIYAHANRVTRSILHAQLVAEVEVEDEPEDPQDFADQYGGDYLEVAPGEENHE